MMKSVYKILNVLFFIVMVTMNFLANYLPLNGKGTGELSDLYPNLFVPAGITFAIWGLIYLLLTIFTIYQIGLIKKKSDFSFVKKIGPFYFISSILNAVWILCWHYEKVLFSLIIMVLLLLTLIKIYLNLKKWSGNSYFEKFIVKQPFNVYLGWITVATIANVTTFLVDINWDGFGISSDIWTVIMISAAALIAIIAILKEKNYLYSLVIVWAISGIIIKQTTVFENKYENIILASAISIGVILISIIIKLISGKKK